MVNRFRGLQLAYDMPNCHNPSYRSHDIRKHHRDTLWYNKMFSTFEKYLSTLHQKLWIGRTYTSQYKRSPSGSHRVYSNKSLKYELVFKCGCTVVLRSKMHCVPVNQILSHTRLRLDVKATFWTICSGRLETLDSIRFSLLVRRLTPSWNSRYLAA